MGRSDETKMDYIAAILQELEFGSIVITVHDGVITQVDTTEKKRFTMEKGYKPKRKIK